MGDWQKETLTAMVGGIVGTPEQWEEDPVAAGAYATASIGTFFIPVVGQAGAAAKVASSLARVGVAVERLAVIAVDGSRIASGLSRTGTTLTNLSKGVAMLTGTTSTGATVRNINNTITALDDIPDLVPASLTSTPHRSN